MMHMPMLGLGTWQLRGPEGRDVVTRAVELGYRHLDTAQMYQNEAEVGAGLRAASVSREQVFVVTKVHQDRFAEGRALDSARASIDRLGIGAVDLLLCHWPPKGVPVARVIEDLLACQAAGLTRAIGVSNFNVPQMAEAAALAPIATNQVEFHPLIDQSRLLAQARQLGFPLTAYAPIIRGKALDLPPVQAAAAAQGADPAAVVLAWVIAQGVVALCNSTREARLISNLTALPLRLTPAEQAAISAMTAQNRRFIDHADWAPDWNA